MNASLISTLNAKYREFPILKGEPCTDGEVATIERELNVKLDKDYVEFIKMYGGAMVGTYPIVAIHNSEVMDEDSIIDVTSRYRDEWGDSLNNWYVISYSQSGSPVGMTPEGIVYIWDHDLGGIAQLTKSFDEFLEYCLSL